MLMKPHNMLVDRLLRHRPRIRPDGLIFAVCLSLVWWAATSQAQDLNLFNASQPAAGGQVEVSLLSEGRSIQPGRPFWVGIRFDIEDHWHINWRNAGDAGLPPVITWDLPAGYDAGEIQWPVPERLVVEPLVSYGYEGTVVFPVEITPPVEASGEARLHAVVDWLVCKDVCVPGGGEVELSLPVQNEPPVSDDRWTNLFSDTRFQLPLERSEWRIAASMDDEFITLRMSPPDWWDDDPGEVFFLPYAGDLMNNSAAQVFEAQEDSYTLTVTRARNNPGDPQRVSGLLVSSSGWRGSGSETALAFDVGLGETDETATSATAASTAIWGPLLFALLGGMILNLMPCVLPVLSIKVMGLVQQAGETKSSALSHGLLYTAGVVVSFWILAGVLIALRAAGEQLGWGFQLQSPTFVVIVAGLFFLLGLSLFGVFEIGASLIGLGSKSGSGAFGAFNSGILAVIVATPCTAPFMGSALGYALTQPVVGSLLVFTALGLGLALPYLIFTASPALLRFVPKPGAWMETLKQLMGFLLMATVVWLAWVLGNQAGAQAIAVLLSMLLLLSVAAWIWGRWGNLANSGRTRILASIVALSLAIVGVGWGLKGIHLFGTTAQAASGQESGWEPYSEERVQELVTSGRRVLVDFTADWCLSCQVNERVALASESVEKRLHELDVALLKADWTLRDAKIAAALAGFGRNSVPLYVLYSGKAGDEPVILPAILTPGIVLEALDRL
jgi:thiol:disulfide interchange protein